MPSFLKKTKAKPASDEAVAAKKPAKGPAPTATPDQDTVGNQALAEKIASGEAQQAAEPSLLDELTEEKAKPAKGKAGKAPLTPEQQAQKQAVLEESLIASGLMKAPKKPKADTGVTPVAQPKAKKGLLHGAKKSGSSAIKSIQKGFGGGKKTSPAVGLTSVAPAAAAKSPDEVAAESVLETHQRALAEHDADIEAYLAAHPDVIRNGDGMRMRGGGGHLETAKDAVAKAKTPEETGRVGKDGQEPAVKGDPHMLRTMTLNKSEIEALRALGLTQDEIIAVNMYTTDAAYMMNDVLRGQVRYENAVREMLPWAMKLDSALAKLPRDVLNTQADGSKIDDTQDADARVALKTAYRGDKWQPSFATYACANFAVGKRLADPGFFSASTKQGSYLDLPVNRVIDMNGTDAAASVIGLSNNKKENEVLFRPGTQMQVTKVIDTTNGKELKDLSGFDADMLAMNAKRSIEDQQHVEVHVKVLGGPKGGKPAKSGGQDPKAAAKAKDADKKTVRGILAKSPVS